MLEYESSKISPADKQPYFKIRKRTSQRILRVFAPSREVSKEMGKDSREGAKEESDARERGCKNQPR